MGGGPEKWDNRPMSLFLFLLLLVAVLWARSQMDGLQKQLGMLRKQLEQSAEGHCLWSDQVHIRLRALEVWRDKQEPPYPMPPPAPQKQPAPISPLPSVAERLPAPSAVFKPADKVLPPVEKKVPSLPPPLPTIALNKVVSEPQRPPQAEVNEVVSQPEESPVRLEPSPAGSGWNWEQFLGVKFFAWVGGLLTFLTVAFFIKLSLERGWISNEMRIITGYVLGLAALVGGVRLHRNERYRVLAQTFCATGVLILYGSTFAAHSIYAFISAGAAFAIMACVTCTAFVLAVRLSAQVIAILGMVGGFLTPMLCSTGRDQPVALFSYIALLNFGLIAVARRKDWSYLLALAAFGTIVTQLGWSVSFFLTGEYAVGGKTWFFAGIFAFFAAQFSAAHRFLKPDYGAWDHSLMAALAVNASAALSAFALLGHASVVSRPPLGFALMSVVFALSVWMRWHREPGFIAPGTLSLTFVHLILWISLAPSDHALLLTFYVLLLNAAALIIDRVRPGSLLPLFAALCSAVAAFAWGLRFFELGGWHLGAATIWVMLVLLSLPVLHLAFGIRNNAPSALLLCAAMLLMSFALLAIPEVSLRPAVLYLFVFAINALTLLVVWKEASWQIAQEAVAGATFIHLGAWTVAWLKPDQLLTALVLYLIFGVAHTLHSMLMIRRDGTQGPSLNSFMPLMSIALMLLPIIRSSEVSLMIWPALMIANLVVMAVAWVNGRLNVVLAGMALTFGGALIWMQKLPSLDGSLSRFLGVLGGISVVFMFASSLLLRRASRLGMSGTGFPPVAVPVSSAVMPFALLGLSVTQMPMASPTPVFGLVMVLSLFLLGLAVWLREGLLALVATACALAVQALWHANHFQSGQMTGAIAWYASFGLLFLVFPFSFSSRFSNHAWSWIAAAVAPLGAFVLVRAAVVSAGGLAHMGLLPLAFAVPSLAALFGAVRLLPGDAGARIPALAWLGGVLLFFVTLFSPMEFSRQYLSMSWALEGAALIWLFRRVPYRGLVWVGLALLATVFVRLGLNLQLVESYPRGGMMIWNWHLATYGTAITALLAAAKWLQEPHDFYFDLNVRALLCAFAGVLGFVWINLEITDVFTPAGQPTLLIDLQNASVGRRMTYSIAWAGYALILILAGFFWRSRGARYAGIGLMVITIAKVFLRDLASLDSLYRIGALGAVAVMALAASFVYQRFFERSGDGPKNE